MNEEKFIVEHWDLLDSDWQDLCRGVGISPEKNIKGEQHDERTELIGISG